MNVVAHDDQFTQGALDRDWIPAVAARGWIILTRDRRIVRNSIEFNAVINANARQFVVTDAHGSAEVVAASILKARKAMERRVRTLNPPFVLAIRPNGTVSKWKLPKRAHEALKRARRRSAER